MIRKIIIGSIIMLVSVLTFATDSYLPKAFSIISQVANCLTSESIQNLPNYSYIFIQNKQAFGPYTSSKLAKIDQWQSLLLTVNKKPLTLSVFLNENIKAGFFLTADLKNVIEIGFLADKQTIVLTSAPYSGQTYPDILEHRGPVVLKWFKKRDPGNSEWTDIKGIVFNDSPEDIDDVEVEIDIYDKHMNMIDTETVPIDSYTLKAFARSTFYTPVEDPIYKIGKVVVSILNQ